MKPDLKPLLLGSEVIELLIPHRPPFLMIDTVLAVALGERPSIRTARQISASEPVFAGHFPGLRLWPGVYTLEGMGQSCAALSSILALQEAQREAGGDPEEVLAALRNLALGYRLSPAFRPSASEWLGPLLGGLGGSLGMAGSVEAKLLEPVFAGSRLEFTVTLTHRVKELLRFEGEAVVDGRVVARGTLTAGRSPPLPRGPRG